MALPAESEYGCTNCGRVVGKRNLTSKKVFFGDVGKDSGIFRARTVHWLCNNCLGKDPDYNYPSRVTVHDRIMQASLARARRVLG